MEIQLNELIEQYATNKSELETIKKVVDKQNLLIKDIMLKQKLDTHIAGQYRATVSVSNRVSMNEEMLLQIAHHFGIPEIVKTKEYIDYDVLEKAIYEGKISEDVLLEMDKAKESKEVVTLKVTKIKKKEDV